MIHHIKRVTLLILFWLVIVLAVGLTSVRIILKEVEDYKTELENKIFELTTIPIEIGKLRAGMRGYSPEVILKDIQVLATDSNEKPAIQLEEVRLGIDLIQLIFTQEALASSWLTLVGAKLSIVRKIDGSLSIVGLNTGDSEQPFWLLEGGRYEVLKSDISWLDEQQKKPVVEFKQVDLLIKNEFDKQTHEIHLISQLPHQYGKSLRVSMSLQGNIFEPDNINGMVYVEADEILLAELFTSNPLPGIRITEGEGLFRLWSQWNKSKLSSIAASVQAKKIVVKNKTKKENIFRISELNSKINVISKENGWGIRLNDFVLKNETQAWPAANLSVFVDNELSQLSAYVRQVELEELAELIQFFSPLDEDSQELISKLGLKGILKDFSFYANSETKHYAVNGMFENIATHAYSNLPQVENFSGSIKGTNENGLISINTKNASLFFPDLFRNPFLINKLTGLMAWQQMPNELQLSSKRLIVDTKDVQTETQVTLIIPKNDDAVFMDLQSSFSSSQDISHAPEYYPFSIMDKDLVNWLDNAFVSGKIEKGNVLVYGELNKFPFTNAEGVFEVLYNMEDVELHYDSEWPNLTNASAEILFLKNSVTIKMAHAEVNNLNIKHAVITIPSLSKSEHLLIQGQVVGRIIDGLTFLQQTPLHASVDTVLDAITPDGFTNVDLDLKIPLTDTGAVKVDGVAHIKKADLKVKAVDLDILEVAGDLRFTEQGLFCYGINAQSLGYPIDIKIENKNFSTSIIVEGKTEILQLKKQFSFIDKEFLTDKRISGSTAYQLTLDLPNVEEKPAKLDIKTNLYGVAIELPGTLKKLTEEKKPLNISFLLSDKELMPLTLNYDERLKAAVNINKQQNSLHSAYIVYGKGDAFFSSKQGINIEVEQDLFDLSEWTEMINIKPGYKDDSKSGINRISFNIKQLRWNNKSYGNFEMAIKRLNKEWQGQLSSTIAKGLFSIPYNRGGKDKIKFNLDYLSLSALMQLNTEGNNDNSEDLPLIKVESKQFFWNESDLGKLELETERINERVRFNKINVTSANNKIELETDWIKNETISVTEMKGTLIVEDFGEFLTKLGFDNDIEESSGNVEYSGSWPGSPYQFSLANLDAELNVELKSGRISSIEPGFGRFLGLIAMEQWLKRLTLNFGDLFKQGLSVNSITGNFKVSKGKAQSKDLSIDSVPALITISGEADLINETLDHHVIVVPKSSAAVPIAGKIVSTIAGTITQAFTKDYQEGFFFGSRYKVTGHWDDVEITPLHDQDGILKKTWEGLTDFTWITSSTVELPREKK